MTEQAPELGMGQYLAAQEAISVVGIAQRFAEHTSRVARQQFEWLQEDGRLGMEELGKSRNPCSAMMRFQARQLGHQLQGWADFIAAVQNAAAEGASAHNWLWSAGHPSSLINPRVHSLGLLARLRTDHKRVADIVKSLQKLVGNNNPDVTKLFAHIDYLAEYPELVHHPLEDRIFNQMLLNPGLDDAQREQVERNAEQHQELNAATAEILQHAEQLLAEHKPLSGEFRALVEDYVKLQLEHMNFEEQVVFPVAERWLSRSDWIEIDTADLQTHDPLFDQKVTRYDELYRYVTMA